MTDSMTVEVLVLEDRFPGLEYLFHEGVPVSTFPSPGYVQRTLGAHDGEVLQPAGEGFSSKSHTGPSGLRSAEPVNEGPDCHATHV